MLHYFQVTKTHKTDFISALQCSNKHTYLIHISHLALHDYPGSAFAEKRGTISPAAIIGLDQVVISA